MWVSGRLAQYHQVCQLLAYLWLWFMSVLSMKTKLMLLSTLQLNSPRVSWLWACDPKPTSTGWRNWTYLISILAGNFYFLFLCRFFEGRQSRHLQGWGLHQTYMEQTALHLLFPCTADFTPPSTGTALLAGRLKNMTVYFTDFFAP